MPRKPKPPPHEFIVQGLSTGEVIERGVGVDDFTGEPIAVAERYGPFIPPKNLRVQLERKRKQHAQEQRVLKRTLLQTLGLVESATTQRSAAPTEHKLAKPFKRRI